MPLSDSSLNEDYRPLTSSLLPVSVSMETLSGGVYTVQSFFGAIRGILYHCIPNRSSSDMTNDGKRCQAKSKPKPKAKQRAKKVEARAGFVTGWEPTEIKGGFN